MRVRGTFVAVGLLATALPLTALFGAAQAGSMGFTISVADPTVQLKETFTVQGQGACASSPYTVTFVFTTKSGGSGQVTASGTTNDAGEFTQDITVPETAVPQQPASVQATVECPGETSTTAPPTTEAPTTAPPTTAPPAETASPTPPPPTETVSPTPPPPTETVSPTPPPPTETVQPTASETVQPTGGAVALRQGGPDAQRAMRAAAIEAALGVQAQAGPNTRTSNTVEIQIVVATGVLSTDKTEGRAGTLVAVDGTNCLGDDAIVVFGNDRGAERVPVTLLPDDTFEGSYAIPNVPPGAYFFAAQCPGTDYADRAFTVLETPGASPSPLPPINPLEGPVTYTG